MVSKLPWRTQRLFLNVVTDPTNLVRRSIDLKQPVMVVSLNYRLNIFAFGNCNSDPHCEKNLALSDQRAALDFVRLHIRGFGGDPVEHTAPTMVS